MGLEDLELNEETEELIRTLRNTGMGAQVFCTQMSIIMRGSPDAGKRLVEGTLDPEQLVDKTMEMYDIEDDNLSYNTKCRLANEAIQMAQNNTEQEA